MASSKAWPRAVILTVVLTLALGPLAGCVRAQGDLNLVLGSMMPLTGGLNSLGSDMENGVRLAVEEVNAAGSKLHVQVIYKDDKTSDSSGAPTTFNQLTAQGVTAIAGPCCSGVTSAVLEKAVESEVVVASPSATSPSLTEKENKGYFLRIAPSDALQGVVLARLVKEQNVTTVSLIAINNAYGNGLVGVFSNTYTTELGGVVLRTARHDEGATQFSSQVDSACSDPKPQAVVLLTYVDEGAAILKEMQAKACLAQVKIFGSEGVYNAQFATKAGTDPSGKHLAAGAMGTTPEAGNSSVYNAKFKARFGHDPSLYSAESYDAAMYIMVAAYKAKSTEGRKIAAQLLDIANPPGETVSDFKRAVELIDDGKEINWAGMAHDFEFDSKQEPKKGFYSYWQVQADGTMKIVATGKTV